jgi:hypothetical protein
VHKARGDAEKAWQQTSDIRPDMDTLMAATERYSQDQRVIQGFGKYPAGWLRSKCWLDEPTQQQNGSANGSGPGKQTNYSDEEYTSGW